MAPPLRLPGQHFAAAAAFLVLGGAGLIRAAPMAAGGAFSALPVIAVVHLFTLGWITTSIMGALYQLLPVALGAPIRSETLGHASFYLYVPGVALMIGGLYLGRTLPAFAGAAASGAGLLLFLGNLAATLPAAERRGLTWWCLVGAGVFLLTSLVLGVLLAANLRWGVLGGRFLVVGLHMHIAAGGWVLLTMIGVAHHLMPMFLLSHGVPELPGRLAAGLVATGAAVLALLHHAIPMSWLPAAGLLLAAGALAFLVQCGLHYRASRKPEIDPGMKLVAVALVLLAAAVALGPPAMIRGTAAPRLAAAYTSILVVGGLGLFVAGHYYRILPFLVWFHHFGPVAAERDVPRVTELYDHRLAAAATLFLGLGAAGVAAAVGTGWPAAARAAALVFAGGTGVLALQMWRVARRRPAPDRRETADAPPDVKPGTRTR